MNKLSVCPSCGKAVNPDAKFCGGCGAKIEPVVPAVSPDTFACPACGRSLKIGAKFCGYCGTIITVSAEQAKAECVVAPAEEVVAEKTVEEPIDSTAVAEETTEVEETPAEDLCPACGKELKPGAKFCGACGTVIGEAKETEADTSVEITPTVSSTTSDEVKMTKCDYCGKMIKVGSKFCGYCAKPVTPKPAPALKHHSDFRVPDSL